MKTLNTYYAHIYVGFKEGYVDGCPVHSIDEAREICQQYVDNVGLAVTLEPVEFVYTNGCEPGCRIGLINYPRFPATPDDIRMKAIDLSRIFLDRFGQYRISIVCPDVTIMLEQEIDGK